MDPRGSLRRVRALERQRLSRCTAWCLCLAAALAAACSPGGGHGSNHNNVNAQPVDPLCTSVRLTSYTASTGGWCEFDRTLPVLPAFVRSGMTTAIAEPWNGGSYEGASGESCGECWEVSTIDGIEVVMVHDLCPVRGNPLCAGAHFHFDLSTEAAQALGAGGLDEGRARRVPCPVTGNVHVQILDWNQWGYVRLSFVNHRIPVREAALRFSSMTAGAWHPMERSGGAWHALEAPNPTSGDDIFFRFTSAQGETLESVSPVGLLDTSRRVFDLGVQLTDQNEPTTGQCLFTPPHEVYVDGWGGIDQVRWMPNPWGDTSVAEVSTGCHEGSASCLRVSNMVRWSGMHIYYRQVFSPSTFATFSFWARTSSGTMPMRVSLSGDGDQCDETPVDIGPTWTRHVIDLAAVCQAVPAINTITWQNVGDQTPLLMDDLVFDE